MLDDVRTPLVLIAILCCVNAGLRVARICLRSSWQSQYQGEIMGSYDHELVIAQRRAILAVEEAKRVEREAKAARLRAETRLALILGEIKTGKMGRELIDAIHAKQLEQEAAEREDAQEESSPPEDLQPTAAAAEEDSAAEIPPAKAPRRRKAEAPAEPEVPDA